MKVRVKIGNNRKTIDIPNNGNETTLCQFKQEIVNLCNLLNSECNVSLNGTDILEGEEKTLSKFGIVSGDLVFVILQNDQQASVEQKKSSFEFPSTSRQSSFKSESNMDSSSQTSHEQPNQDSPNQELLSNYSELMEYRDEESESVDRAQIDKCLKEPLLCRESTENSIPATLNDLHRQTPCENCNDALWIVIHTLMLESGFVNVHTSLSGEKENKMAAGWKTANHYSGHYYHVDLNQDVTCKLIGLPMGSKMVVHGQTTDTYETKQVQIKTADYIQSLSTDGVGTYKNLHRLSLIIKDSITFPLLQELNNALGLPQVFGFLGLNFELKLKILSYLDCASLVRFSEVCKQMNLIHKDPYLWRRLHFTTFGGKSNTDLSQDWYEHYKQKYKSRKEFYKRMQQSTIVSPSYSWYQQPRPYPPFAPIYPNHGIIGGDYDLNPQFPGMPDPLFGRRQRPGSGLQILRPRYDPIGPIPDPGLLHERGRPSNTNTHWFGRAMGNRFL